MNIRTKRQTAYGLWAQMRYRCNNKNCAEYKSYGGRGIRVCDRWASFRSFIEDMGERPSPTHTLDRINNDAGYGPNNCRWTTAFFQNRNSRRTRPITIAGVTLCAADWGRVLGLKKSMVFNRIHRGWEDRMAVMTPVGVRRK